MKANYCVIHSEFELKKPMSMSELYLLYKSNKQKDRYSALLEYCASHAIFANAPQEVKELYLADLRKARE